MYPMERLRHNDIGRLGAGALTDAQKFHAEVGGLMYFIRNIKLMQTWPWSVYGCDIIFENQINTSKMLLRLELCTN